MKRLPFKRLSASDLTHFQSFLSPSQIIEDPSQLLPYNQDWTSKYKGHSPLCLLPKTTQQVSQILSHCNSQKLAIVPQGGNTGLVGGSNPVYDEIILSLKKMDTILTYNPNNRIFSTQAGVILQQANDYLHTYESELPWDLGAKGSCQIGGNISTHAAGKYLIRNGPLRGYIMGLKAVMANGDIMDYSSQIRKDNTGPDMKQMFIGSEGTLGVVTEVDVVTVPLLKERKVVFAKLGSFEQVIQIMRFMQRQMGPLLVAFEYMDSFAYQAIADETQLQLPFQPDQKSFYALMEVGGSLDFSSHLDSVFSQLMEENIIQDAIISQNEQEYDNLWMIREQVAVACSKRYKNHKYDLSVPAEIMDDFVRKQREKVKGEAITVGYGHVADGNVHLNVLCQGDFEKIKNILEPTIFEEVQQLKGSISAEHGLGLQKGKYLHLSKDEGQIRLLQQMKALFDPNGILNPYKVYK